MSLTFSELKAFALIIQEATGAQENTAVRVGTMFREVLDYIAATDSSLLALIQAGGTGGGGTAFGGLLIGSETILNSTVTPNGYPVKFAEVYAPLGCDNFALLVLPTGNAGEVTQIAYFYSTKDSVMVRTGNATGWTAWANVGGGSVETNGATTKAVGGIALGTNLNGMDAMQILDEMLYAEVFPTINEPIRNLSFNPSNQATTMEVGEPYTFSYQMTTINERGSIVPFWENVDDTIVKIASKERTGALLGDTVVYPSLWVQPDTSALWNGKIGFGSNVFYINRSYAQGPAIIGSKGSAGAPSFSAQTLPSNTLTITGRYKMLYGASASIDLAAKDAQNNFTALTGGLYTLANQLVSIRQISAQIDASGGKYLYFAIPTYLGCTVEMFKVFGTPNNDWTKVTGQLENQYGFSTSYDIFRSNNLQNGSAIAVQII